MADKVPRLQIKGKRCSVLQRLGQAGLDLCYPPHCLQCGVPLHTGQLRLCASCLPQLPLLSAPLCELCGIPFPFQQTENNHHCGHCLQKTPSFTRSRAIFPYNEMMARFIHRLKFHGDKTALTTLALLARQSPLLTDLEAPELIIPVPLHRKRLQERCFNQASLLAHALFAGQREKICHPLERHRPTKPQLGLTGRERRRNVVGAFQVRQAAAIKGKRVLLIDDVFTTGSTLNACAQTLTKAGSGPVQALTMAVALPPK